MNVVLSIAILVTFATTLAIAVRFRNTRCTGPMAVSPFTFLAILFTSGLDVGLIMFPLIDFGRYAGDATYAFASPLAIEFGFWGFLVWGFYFLTTFYFSILEPRLKLFEIPAIKLVNNAVVIGTCAFTAYLFLLYLPDYVTAIGSRQRYALVALVVLAAVVSSTDIRYVKLLSVASTWLFFALVFAIWADSGMGVKGLATTLTGLGGYFANLHRFVLPMSDYHAFYLFWWFAWSIMIGQFVARFVSGFSTLRLLVALLVVPSVPIAIWFTVLYFHFENGIVIEAFWKLAMLVVGIIFVVNSLDSLTRLYTQNLGFTVERVGWLGYIAANWSVLFALVLLYHLTPLRIEWIGLVVIALYAAVYALLIRQRRVLVIGSI